MTIQPEDILLSKAVDGTATDEEWDQLESIGSVDPTIWRRFGEMNRLQSHLDDAIDQATQLAQTVELDMDRARSHHVLSIRVRSWSGWAVAAILTLALLGGRLGLLSSHSNTAQSAGLLSLDASPDEVLEQYRTVGTLDGRFVSELPTVMVDMRVDPSTGQAEMFYMRRFLERVRVDGLYTSDPLAHDVVPVIIPTSTGAPRSPRQF